MTGNLALDIAIIAAAAIVLLAALVLGGVVKLEGFGVRMSASRNKSTKTEILNDARVAGKVGKIRGQVLQQGEPIPASDTVIGQRLVVNRGGEVGDITGTEVTGAGRDGSK